MKYVILLCDGMADTPNAALGGKTPMEAADKPCMDQLAHEAEIGMVRTVQQGMSPGSDVANLTVLGYDTRECYTGRSPLEAANIGIELAPDDVALRCNLVTLSGEEKYAQKRLTDYCAGDIHTGQAAPLIARLQSSFGGGEFDFYTGTAYRHCLVWHHGKSALGRVTPPHDITGQVIGPYLPLHPDAAPLLSMMEKSVELLQDQKTANAIWLWGQGSRPRLSDFYECTGKRGSVISAVDLIKGIGRLSGMRVCDVPGATGYIDTNFEGKRDAALQELKEGQDFVYIHVEAPDECGHRGEAENKVTAIEQIDRLILSPLVEELKKMGEFHLLILPDHPTPLAIRTHSSDPVPYLLYRSEKSTKGVGCFTEASGLSTGRFVEEGRTLIDQLW